MLGPRIKPAGITTFPTISSQPEEIENSALVGEGPFALGAKTALGAGRTADEVTQTNVTPRIPIRLDRVVGTGRLRSRNAAYKTAGPGGAFLTYASGDFHGHPRVVLVAEAIEATEQKIMKR